MIISMYVRQIMTCKKDHKHSFIAFAAACKAQPVLDKTPLDILQGSVIRYAEPTAPVAEDDWEHA